MCYVVICFVLKKGDKGKTTRMFGCLVHNHADNPTMKRISWMQRRRVARHLLLGHTRADILKNIMPRLHIEGQKRVDAMDIK